MFFKKNKPSSSRPDEDIFFSSEAPLPYSQDFAPPGHPQIDRHHPEAASAPPPLFEAPAVPVSHQEALNTSEDHLEDLWFRMSPAEGEGFSLETDLDKPEFDFALDIDRSPDIDRAAGQLVEAPKNIEPMKPIFDAAMPRESGSPDWRVARPDSALLPEDLREASGTAHPNEGLAGYGDLPEIDPWLDPVNRSLYPEGAFGGIESDLEAETRAFEEAAHFLFPETVSAPLEWDMPRPSPEPLEMGPAALLGDSWETFPHEVRGPVDLGPDFQAGARELSDLSHQETTGDWSMFMAASSRETQGADDPLSRPAFPLETPLTPADFEPLSDQPQEAVDLESAWFMESPFPEAAIPLNAFASPFASHETAPTGEELADQDFYVTEFTFDEAGALIPKTDEAPNIFAEPALPPPPEPEATTVWPKTDEAPDIFAEPALTPLSEPGATAVQPEPEKDFEPIAEPPEERAIFQPVEIEGKTPDHQPQSQPQAQGAEPEASVLNFATTEPEAPVLNFAATEPEAPVLDFATTEPEAPVLNFATMEPEAPVLNFAATEPEAPVLDFAETEPEEPVWNFAETEPEEASDESCGVPSPDLSALPLESISAVTPLISPAPSPAAPLETHEAPPADIKPEPPDALPEENAERPVAPAIRLGNLEVLGICPVRPDCRLLIIHSNGAYALMSQLGREQPKISVLKLFEYNPIAYQSTFVAVENTPHPDRPGRFLVQAGLWRGMVSILKDQVTLYRELG